MGVQSATPTEAANSRTMIRSRLRMFCIKIIMILLAVRSIMRRSPAAALDSQSLPRPDVLQLVDKQLPVGSQRYGKMRKGARCRAFKFRSVGLELAAMARAGNHVCIWFPLSDAAEMCANSGHGIKSFRHTHNINLLVLKKRDGMHGIKIRIPGAEGRRRLEQDTWRKILIGHCD